MTSAQHPVVAFLIKRLPLMAVMYVLSLVVHTYLLAWVNDGFEKQSWVSPYVHVRNNGTSATLIWTSLSALAWSFLFGMFKQGPIRAATNLFNAPIARFKSAGKDDLPAAVMGAGAALVLSGLFSINPQANLSLGISWTLLGSSTTGRYAAQGLMRAWPMVLRSFSQAAQGRTRLTLRVAQLIVAGMGPGFLIARFVPIWPLLLGTGLIVFGAVRWSKTLPDGFTHSAGVLVITVAGGGLLHLLWSLVAPLTVEAHDYGRREAGGDFWKWFNSPGRGQALEYGSKPSLGSAVGPLVAPPEDEEDEDIERDREEGDEREPPEQEDEDTPFDPTDEKKREMWERDGVVWDPHTLSWRPPRRDEMPPPPPDGPEGPVPFKKNHPRTDCPPECLGFYDQYTTAQSNAEAQQRAFEQAEKEYEQAITVYNNNVMKALAVLGLDGATALGSAIDSAASAARPRGRGRAGSGTSDPYHGPATRLGNLIELVQQASARVAQVAARVAELAAELIRRTGIVEGLKKAVLEIRLKIQQAKALLEGAVESAARVARLEQAAEAAAKRVTRIRELIRRLEVDADTLRQRISRLEAEKPKWDAWWECDQRCLALEKDLEALKSQKRQLQADYKRTLEFHQRQRNQLANDVEALRDAGRLAEAETLRLQIARVDQQIENLKADRVRRLADADQGIEAARGRWERALDERDVLEGRCNPHLDSAELPIRESELANKERSLGVLQKQLDEAIAEETRIQRSLGPGGLDGLRRFAETAEARLKKARTDAEIATSRAENLRKRVERLEAEKPKWNEWSRAVDVLEALKAEADALRRHADALARERSAKIAGLQTQRAQALARQAAATDPDDIANWGRAAREYEDDISQAKAKYDRLEADANEKLALKRAEEGDARVHEQHLSERLDHTADPRELPERRRQLHEQEGLLKDADHELGLAIDDSSHARDRLDTAVRDINEASARVNDAKASLTRISAEIETVQERLRLLREEKPKWDAARAAAEKVKELEGHMAELRMKQVDIERRMNLEIDALEHYKKQYQTRLDDLDIPKTQEQIDRYERQIVELDEKIKRVREEAAADDLGVESQIQAKHIDKDSAMAAERRLRGELDDSLNPVEIARRERELHDKEVDLTRVRKELTEAEDIEAPLRREIEAEKTKHPRSPSEIQHEIDGLEQTATTAEARLAEETTAQANARTRHEQAEQDLKTARDAEQAAQESLRRGNTGGNSAPQSRVDVDPNDNPNKPDAVEWFEDRGADIGGWIASAIGGQSGEEMAEVLRECQEQLDERREWLASVRQGLDAAMREMRDLKPQLDACVTRFQQFDEGATGA